MTYDNFSTLKVSVDAGVAFATIDHPPVNLLDAELITELDRFVGTVANDTNVRVVVFQSADPEFFIAHGDMNFVNNPESLVALQIGGENDPSLNTMQRFHERIRSLRQVTIGKLARSLEAILGASVFDADFAERYG